MDLNCIFFIINYTVYIILYGFIKYSFITLSECDHLDNKHTIFGELMGGMPVLYKINVVPVSKEKP